MRKKRAFFGGTRSHHWKMKRRRTEEQQVYSAGGKGATLAPSDVESKKTCLESVNSILHSAPGSMNMQRGSTFSRPSLQDLAPTTSNRNKVIRQKTLPDQLQDGSTPICGSASVMSESSSSKGLFETPSSPVPPGTDLQILLDLSRQNRQIIKKMLDLSRQYQPCSSTDPAVPSAVNQSQFLSDFRRQLEQNVEKILDLSRQYQLCSSNDQPVPSAGTHLQIISDLKGQIRQNEEKLLDLSRQYRRQNQKKRLDLIRLNKQIRGNKSSPSPPVPFAVAYSQLLLDLRRQNGQRVIRSSSNDPPVGSSIDMPFSLLVPLSTHLFLPPIVTEHFSAANTLPAHSHLQLSRKISSHLLRSHSLPSLSKIDCAKTNFTRAKSLPDMLLKDSFEEFSPDIIVDENEETYRFLCPRPGLYQCSETGLVFHMEGEGDVLYRIVPWNHRLLAQFHKKPAGPLFDIKCLQQSVCQLHLRHCEIRSTGGCEFLSVAHVNDEGMELITPHRITETHVIISITGFSAFGIMKDEDSPPDPVRALVLLFYRPPTDPDPESELNVLLLPKNVVLREVQRVRKKLVGDERYIETSPHCKLCPKQEYTLSTSPEDDSVLVQPTEAEFDEESYNNYFPSFQVILEKSMKHMKLILRDSNSSLGVWERRVCLLSTGVRKPCGSSASKRLMEIRTPFINGISGPVLKSLLDKLLEKMVITDSERETADEEQNQRDKARFVIDTVRKKGDAASSEMIEFLCEDDPFLCEHLGLM